MKRLFLTILVLLCWVGSAGAETLGPELWDADAAVFTSGTYSWVARGGNSIDNDSNTLKITYIDDAKGALTYLRDSYDLSSDLTIGQLYELQFDAKVNVGSVIFRVDMVMDVVDKVISNTTFETYSLQFIANFTTGVT